MRPRTQTAFTLLEVILAMTIFGLVTLGVLATFRTATRSYERSGRAMAGLQSARAIQDTIGRDLRSAFLVNETNYGVRLPGNESQSDAPPPVLPESGTGSSADPLSYGQAGLVEDQIEYDSSLEADLSFTLTGGTGKDELSFVRRLRPVASSRVPPPGALVRVTYTVDGDDRLVRRTQIVYGEAALYYPEPGMTREEAEQARRDQIVFEEPKEEFLAEGVEVFDVRCIHWADGQWLATDQWDSSEVRARDPLADQSLPEDDPNAGLFNALRDRTPEDGLPAALEVHLGLRDALGGRTRLSRLLIPIPPAQETWAPPDPQLMESIERSQRRQRRGE